MTIVLIGAGNLATNLGHALSHTSHRVVQVFSRTMESATLLAERLACDYSTDITDIRPDADVYILSVKDAVLATLAERLLTHLKASGNTTPLLVHTAGSMSLDTLPSERRAVLYPMQTFSRTRIVDFADIPTFIEATHQEDLNLIREIADSLTSKVYVLDSERRRHLHLAAVFACNFVNHCYDLSARVLEAQGIPFSVMLPLIDETARKVHTLHPHEAQTGPAVRWDENVIHRQMELLGDRPEMKEIYDLMSKSIHRTS